MTVRYRPVVHDGTHTAEQQIYLLALAASKAWGAWAGTGDKPSGVQGISAELDDAMRELYRQCYQTDVFMGGVEFSAALSADKSHK